MPEIVHATSSSEASQDMGNVQLASLKASDQGSDRANLWIQQPATKLALVALSRTFRTDESGIYLLPRREVSRFDVLHAELEQWRGVAAEAFWAFEDSLDDA